MRCQEASNTLMRHHHELYLNTDVQLGHRYYFLCFLVKQVFACSLRCVLKFCRMVSPSVTRLGPPWLNGDASHDGEVGCRTRAVVLALCFHRRVALSQGLPSLPAGSATAGPNRRAPDAKSRQMPIQSRRAAVMVPPSVQ